MNYKIYEERNETDTKTNVHFEGLFVNKKEFDEPVKIEALGSGPIEAFFNAISKQGIVGYEFVNYSEHAISVGSDSKAISYIHLKNPQGKDIFGIGVSHNIGLASMRGILCAINRDKKDDCERDNSVVGIFEK